MDTPADVIDQSVTYMRIYFMGMPFFMLYNYGAAVLRAVGDTKRPLLFLAIAGMANVVLDLLLVIVIPLGGGSCHRNGELPVCFLYTGAVVSPQVRGKLSAPFFEAYD